MHNTGLLLKELNHNCFHSFGKYGQIQKIKNPIFELKMQKEFQL